jgi:hypothetical protein
MIPRVIYRHFSKIINISENIITMNHTRHGVTSLPGTLKMIYINKTNDITKSIREVYTLPDNKLMEIDYTITLTTIKFTDNIND